MWLWVVKEVGLVPLCVGISLPATPKATHVDAQSTRGKHILPPTCLLCTEMWRQLPPTEPRSQWALSEAQVVILAILSLRETSRSGLAQKQSVRKAKTWPLTLLTKRFTGGLDRNVSRATARVEPDVRTF